MIYIVNHTAHEFSFVPESEYKEFYFSMTRGSGDHHRWSKDDKIEAKNINEQLYKSIKELKFRLPTLLAYNQIY